MAEVIPYVTADAVEVLRVVDVRPHDHPHDFSYSYSHEHDERFGEAAFHPPPPEPCTCARANPCVLPGGGCVGSGNAADFSTSAAVVAFCKAFDLQGCCNGFMCEPSAAGGGRRALLDVDGPVDGSPACDYQHAVCGDTVVSTGTVSVGVGSGFTPRCGCPERPPRSSLVSGFTPLTRTLSTAAPSSPPLPPPPSPSLPPSRSLNSKRPPLTPPRPVNPSQTSWWRRPRRSASRLRPALAPPSTHGFERMTGAPRRAGYWCKRRRHRTGARSCTTTATLPATCGC